MVILHIIYKYINITLLLYIILAFFRDNGKAKSIEMENVKGKYLVYPLPFFSWFYQNY